jgi:hypothetical protein
MTRIASILQRQNDDLAQTSTSNSTQPATSSSIPEVQAPASTVATPVASTSAAAAPQSNPSSKQLGLAIGASVGVPIGVIIILAVGLTCLWRWKTGKGTLGAVALRRSGRRQDMNAGGKSVDADDDAVGLKKLEAGLAKPKRPPRSPRSSSKPSTKGVDLVAASLAAKPSVAAKEALQEAEKSGDRKTSLESLKAFSATKPYKQAPREDIDPLKSHFGIVSPERSAPRINEFGTSGSTITPAYAWPLQLDTPDPPIAPPEVLRELRTNSPINPLGSHPPIPPPKDAKPTQSTSRVPSFSRPQASYQPTRQSYSQYSQSQALPTSSQSHSRQKSKQVERPPTPPSPFLETPEITTLPHDRSMAGDPNDRAGLDLSDDDDDISALPPIPSRPESINQSRKSRSIPLMNRSSSSRSKRKSSKKNPPGTSSSHGHTGSGSSMGRPSSSTYSGSMASRPTSPRSTDAPHRMVNSPAYPVFAELQRRAQERALIEQRQTIRSNYGRMMRDWDAGPTRRLGDGRDFIGQQPRASSPVMEGSESPATSSDVRIPTLRGPGSRGQTRAPDLRDSSQQGSR